MFRPQTYNFMKGVKVFQKKVRDGGIRKWLEFAKCESNIQIGKKKCISVLLSAAANPLTLSARRRKRGTECENRKTWSGEGEMEKKEKESIQLFESSGYTVVVALRYRRKLTTFNLYRAFRVSRTTPPRSPRDMPLPSTPLFPISVQKLFPV